MPRGGGGAGDGGEGGGALRGTGGKLAGLADAVLCVESSRTTARIQEGHGMLVHALCEMVEAELAGA